MSEVDMSAETGGFEPGNIADGQPANNTGNSEAEKLYQSPEAGTPQDTFIPENPEINSTSIEAHTDGSTEETTDLNTQPQSRAFEYHMGRRSDETQTKDGPLQFAPQGVPVRDGGSNTQNEVRIEQNLDRATVSPGQKRHWWQKLGFGSKSSVDSIAIPHQGPANPGRRKFLKMAVATGGVVVAGGGAAAAAKLFIPGAASDGPVKPEPTPNNGGIATETAKPATATPSAVDTETPTPSPTATETIAPKPEIIGNGAYNTIEEMPITDAQKETVRKFTEGAEIQFITKGGVVVCLEYALQTSPRVASNISGEKIPVPTLEEVAINTEEFPDAMERIDHAWLRTKSNNYNSEHPDVAMTLDEYKGIESDIESVLWAHNGEAKFLEDGRPMLDDRAISKDSPLVLKFVSDRNKLYITTSNGNRVGYTVENDVVMGEGYQEDPGGIGSSNINRKKSALAGLVATILAQASNNKIKDAGHSVALHIFRETDMPIKIYDELNTDLYNVDEYKIDPDKLTSVFTVKGTPIVA